MSVGLGGDRAAKAHVEHEAQVFEVEGEERVGHRDDDLAALDLDRDDAVLARQIGRYELDHVVGDLSLREIDEGQLGLAREGAGEFLVVEITQPDQRLTDLAAGLVLEADRVVDLLVVDEALILEDLPPDYLPGRYRCRHARGKNLPGQRIH